MVNRHPPRVRCGTFAAGWQGRADDLLDVLNLLSSHDVFEALDEV